MRQWIIFVTAILLARPAHAETFVVVNRMPLTFTATNRMPKCALCDDCQCVVCLCPSVAKPAKPPVVAKKMTTQTVWSTRAPQGHTHTCHNGHTWDHAANPSHACQFCGAQQYVQDRIARPVTVTRVVNVPVLQTNSQARATVPTTSVVAFPKVSTGGCANGQCATVTQFRR